MGRCSVVVVAAVGFICAASAQAATFNVDPNASKLTFRFGGVAKFVALREGPGTASLTGSGMPLTVDASIWSTKGFAPGTSLFSGVPLISNLYASINNLAGVYGPAGSAKPIVVGTGSVSPAENTGVVGVGGTEFLYFLGGAKTKLPFHRTTPAPEVGVGIGGTITAMLQGAGQITITHDRWWTGSHLMTDVSSTVVQLPNRVPPGEGVVITLDPTWYEEVKARVTGGGFITSNPGGVLSVVNSVVIAGSLDVGASGTGTITLVTPLRINTNDLVGRIPGVVRQQFSFVPEPGTVLLFVSGAVALGILGSRRTRK